MASTSHVDNENLFESDSDWDISLCHQILKHIRMTVYQEDQQIGNDIKTCSLNISAFSPNSVDTKTENN